MVCVRSVTDLLLLQHGHRVERGKSYLDIINNILVINAGCIYCELVKCSRKCAFSSGESVCCKLLFTRSVNYFELPPEGPLLDPGQPGVLHVRQGLVPQHGDQGAVVRRHVQVLAAHRVVLCVLESLGYSCSFTLNR